MPHLPLTILARQAFIQDELNASADIMKKTVEQCTDKIIRSVDLIIGALNGRHKILLCGNGGSAADAQHLATEFVIRMDPALRRPALPAIALTTDSSLLTAGANDIGYDNVFAREVEALGQEGDVLIAITTSGRSESVNNAVRAARSLKMRSIGLLGKDGGVTAGLVDVAVTIPSDNTQRIQEGHIAVGHIICSLVEREVFGSPS
jgi:D-sedoheptulose 7-phosphate isomerase